jgi:putative addiction module component (TIGR02574 family)
MTAASEKQFIAKALELPRAARVRLFRELRISLEAKDQKVRGKEWNQAWSAELVKRVEEVDSGKVESIPWSKARKRWRKIVQGG